MRSTYFGIWNRETCFPLKLGLKGKEWTEETLHLEKPGHSRSKEEPQGEFVYVYKLLKETEVALVSVGIYKSSVEGFTNKLYKKARNLWPSR